MINGAEISKEEGIVFDPADPDSSGPTEQISSCPSTSSLSSCVTSVELDGAVTEIRGLNEGANTENSEHTLKAQNTIDKSNVFADARDKNVNARNMLTNHSNTLTFSRHELCNNSNCLYSKHLCLTEKSYTVSRSAKSSISSLSDESSKSANNAKAVMHEQDLDDQTANPDKVKNTLKSMWNNMKYGWMVKMKTNFRYDTPIWLLGKCYHKKMDDAEMRSFTLHDRPQIINGFSYFKDDFFTRLWFTYRKEFPVLAGSSLTTDCGWGCMLRSGQMMLAQGFLMHYLGRHWNWYHRQTSDFIELHRAIIRWFGDIPSNQSPFSIHQLVSLGENSGIKAGEWYGPASVAHIFKRAMEIAQRHDPLTQQVCVYVAQDCTVYKEDLIKLCSSHPSKRWQGVIIFVPARLGGEKLNPIYVPCVRALLAQESCIGIIGGRPRHSLYFVGWQDDSLIYLDPHYCQPVVDVLPDEFLVESFHCLSPRKLPINKMDPSCTIGFYCKTENDLSYFLSTIKDVLVPPKQKLDYPIFIVSEGSVRDAQKCNGIDTLDRSAQAEEKLLEFSHSYYNKDDNTEYVVDRDEFVIL